MRLLIEPGHKHFSIRHQCGLLGLARSTYYFEPAQESEENLALMREIDETNLKYPFFGRRQMTSWLNARGRSVNVKRVERLMKCMGIEAIYPRPRTSEPGKGHKIYPYLLRNVEITHANQVWSTDITYVPMETGYMYLVAIMDWYSRHVIAWRLSNTLDSTFCIDALAEAFESAKTMPSIFNTDQGAQFTSHAFTQLLLDKEIAISMDGKGRALDNVFIERLWRTVKYEEIYLKQYATVADLYSSLAAYFNFYTHERPHQSLGGRTPWNVYTTAA